MPTAAIALRLFLILFVEGEGKEILIGSHQDVLTTVQDINDRSIADFADPCSSIIREQTVNHPFRCSHAEAPKDL